MSQNTPSLHALELAGAFIERHIGPDEHEIEQMLRVVGQPSLEALTDAIVPASIKAANALELPGAMTEVDALASNGMDEIEIPAFLRKQAD